MAGLQALDLMTCALGGFEAINVSQSLGRMPCLNTTDSRLMCLTFFSQLILQFLLSGSILSPSNPLLIKSKCLRYAVIVLLFVQLSHSVYWDLPDNIWLGEITNDFSQAAWHVPEIGMPLPNLSRFTTSLRGSGFESMVLMGWPMDDVDISNNTDEECCGICRQ